MRKALVIGINDYPTSPLTGCVNDAIKVASLLEKHGDGSPNFHVKIVTAPEESLTQSKLRELIEHLFQTDSDIALLYFSGHGTITTTGGYIVTQDGAAYQEGISMDTILTLANRSPARDKIVILDCCYSGAFGSAAAMGTNTSLLGDGVTVLTACRSSEFSYEKDGRGVFTSLLVDALQGGAADIRGNITPGGLYSYVDEALGAWEQRPIFKTNVSRFTSLRTITPEIPPEMIRKLSEYFPNPEDEYQLDPSYEYTEPNAKEENVMVFKELQKFFSVGLVRPVGETYMYFAAINSKSCKLTAMGYQYWRLVKENKV